MAHLDINGDCKAKCTELHENAMNMHLLPKLQSKQIFLMSTVMNIGLGMARPKGWQDQSSSGHLGPSPHGAIAGVFYSTSLPNSY